MSEQPVSLVQACRIAVRCIAGLIPFDAHIDDPTVAAAVRKVADAAQADINTIQHAIVEQ